MLTRFGGHEKRSRRRKNSLSSRKLGFFFLPPAPSINFGAFKTGSARKSVSSSSFSNISFLLLILYYYYEEHDEFRPSGSN